MQKKTKKTPVKQKKKAQSPKKKNDQPFSLKRLIMGEEKPDLTELEAGSTTILDILSPTTIDTKSRDYIVVDGIFHAYLYVAGYGYSTTVGSCWLAPLVEAGEGVNLSFTFKRQPKEKILSKIAQTTMVNRSRMRDVGDTRQDFEELDSAISSGLYLKDAMNRQGEDFYYMHTLLEVTAEDAETLEQRVTAVEKLCVSIDMIARRCDYKNEQAFLSILPLLALDPDVERKSRRNALTSGVAAAPPERARPSHSGVWADGCVQEMVKTIRGLGGIAATSTQGMQDLFGLDGGKYGKGILDSSRIKLVMQMEEQEARLIQGVLNLSEDEVRQITRFRRGEGLLCVGYNHVPVQFHATEKEYDAITTCPTSTIWPLCSASGWIRPKPLSWRGRATHLFTKS